jgi:hypothetical protein
MSTNDRLRNVKVAQKLRELQAADAGFQEELVSGANIKTINGNSLLGAGDLVVGGGGGGGNSVTATVDFGASFTHYSEAVVTGQAWVTTNSEIVTTPLASAGTEMEVALLCFQPVIHSLVAGTGFTLGVFTPIEAKGTYTFSCIGV